MRKLDRPLRLKHALIVAAAVLTLGVGATAIAGGGGDSKDALHAKVTRGVSGSFTGNHFYGQKTVDVAANRQVGARKKCPRGTHVVGGGAFSSAGFNGGAGMMLNSSNPFDGGDGNSIPDDGWIAYVDVFNPAPSDDFTVYAICAVNR